MDICPGDGEEGDVPSGFTVAPLRPPTPSLEEEDLHHSVYQLVVQEMDDRPPGTVLEVGDDPPVLN